MRTDPDDTPFAVLALLGLLALVITATILVFASGHALRPVPVVVSLGVPVAAILLLIIAHARSRLPH
jgi:hypothetical protein